MKESTVHLKVDPTVIVNTVIGETGIGKTRIGNTGASKAGIGKTRIGHTGAGKTGIGNNSIGAGALVGSGFSRTVLFFHAASLFSFGSASRMTPSTTCVS